MVKLLSGLTKIVLLGSLALSSVISLGACGTPRENRAAFLKAASIIGGGYARNSEEAAFTRGVGTLADEEAKNARNERTSRAIEKPKNGKRNVQKRKDSYYDNLWKKVDELKEKYSVVKGEVKALKEEFTRRKDVSKEDLENLYNKEIEYGNLWERVTDLISLDDRYSEEYLMKNRVWLTRIRVGSSWTKVKIEEKDTERLNRLYSEKIGSLSYEELVDYQREAQEAINAAENYLELYESHPKHNEDLLNKRRTFLDSQKREHLEREKRLEVILATIK